MSLSVTNELLPPHLISVLERVHVMAGRYAFLRGNYTIVALKNYTEEIPEKQERISKRNILANNLFRGMDESRKEGMKKYQNPVHLSA